MLARETVSVVIATRDRADLLHRTIASVLAQDAPPLEVLIVDDGSRSPWVPAPELGAHVRALRHDRPRGPGAARNTGIDAARGHWVAFLDDDDLWAPSKLARQLDAARDRPAAGFVYGGALKVDLALRVLERLAAPDPDRLGRLLLHANVIPAGASNALVRADVLRALGGFDTSFSHLADWDMWLRLAEATEAAAVQDNLVAYVQHPGNLVSSQPSTMFTEWARLVGKHDDFARRQNDRMSSRHLVDWYIRRHELAGRPGLAARAAVEAGMRYRRPMQVARHLAGIGVRSLRPRTHGAQPTSAAPPWLARLAQPGGTVQADG